MKINDIIRQEFENLKKKIRSTEFFKVDMHVHTPASKNDYKVDNEFYENTTLDKLKKIAIEKGLFTYENIDEAIEKLIIDEEKMITNKDKNKDLLKDKLMALLIVNEAYKFKKLDLMVITDHNTVEWYENIRNALIEYTRKFRTETRIMYILPGVEITCFSGTHVIAILDPNEDTYKSQWNYIKYELVDRSVHSKTAKPKIFTNKSEMDVIYTIRKAGGIVYVPHIDNNAAGMKIKDMLDAVSGISKAQLFTSPYVQAIGLRNYDRHKTVVENILKDRKNPYYRSSPLAYLQDSDAHNIDDIGKCYMYIKMEKPSFKSLKFALEDPDIRVRKEIEERKNIPQIIGVVTRGGFLSKETVKRSYYPFSDQLNCIIGGRGTGKSTLINCIKNCLEQRVSTIEFRNFMGEFEDIFIYLNNGKNNFCVYCKPQIINDSYTNTEVRRYKDTNINALMDISNWIKVYKITEKTCRVLSDEDKFETLRSFYIDFYEQAEIMKIGENNEYILNLLNKIIERQGIVDGFNKKKQDISKVENKIGILTDKKTVKDIKVVENLLKKLDEEYVLLDKYYINVISTLNEALATKVIIKYERKTKTLCSFFLDYLDIYSKMNNLEQRKIEVISVYIKDKLKSNSLSTIWNKINSNNVKIDLMEIINRSKNSFEDAEDYLSEKECLEIIKDTYYMMLNNIYAISRDVKISVEFNVNSFDKKLSKDLYKEIKILSYGQKAVAILLIITEGMSAFNINIPLIIDQPEDQLDNTFIFEDLVREFRTLKEKRQIILVTHNANIPVCGDAENIICLVSDNEHGWIDINGPLDQENVSKKVMSIMDGGKESFTIRNNKYKVLIKS